MYAYLLVHAAMELECLEDIIREEIVQNREKLELDETVSKLQIIPDDPDKFYIHLADYFDVMAGRRCQIS